MCTLSIRPEDEEFGLLYDASECADYATCLAKTVRALPDATGEVTTRTPVAVSVFHAYGASSYVIELNYFDADFRSEFSVVNLTSFASVSPDVLRVHFFDVAPAEASDGGHLTMRDFVERNVDRYLGYTIIRPQRPTASIGRSIVGLPRGSGLLRPGTSLQTRIRTPVVENVNLFGVPLQATGVPFMEQDANLLRCAHVVAWMAHFTAVLNGYVARRPSGSFNDAEGPVRLLGRAYPSPDISAWSLTHLLSNANLPPEVVTGYRLRNTREFFWFDNPRFVDRVQQIAREGTHAIALPRIWIANNTTATVCRYLNSGIPCIYNYPGHSVLICGYYRARDLPDGRPEDSSVAGFIVMDDQGGPFRELPIDRIVDDVLADEDSVSIVIPLPTGLWLSGEAAELAGAKAFTQLVASVTDLTDNQPSTEPVTTDLVEAAEGESVGIDSTVAVLAPHLADFYGALVRQIQGHEPCTYSIRSYASHGTDFKIDFSERLDHPESKSVIGYVTLPKFVWVIETLDRARHREGGEAVIATIVVDGSASSFDNMRPPAPLLLHLPGLIRRADGGEWQASRSTPYMSGRWAHEGIRADSVAERRRSHHAKWAT